MEDIPPLILASTSPRRAKLLRDAGYVFEQIAPSFDDVLTELPPMAPHHATAALAHQKALDVAGRLRHGIIIGCDTLVSLDGRTIGKPADVNDTRRILCQLFDRWHQVFTAVCMIDASTQRQKLFVEATDVRIHAVSPSELEVYLTSGQWQGKAGGYNLAELEATWQFEIKGDPTTVIGLPMVRLGRECKSFIETSMS